MAYPNDKDDQDIIEQVVDDSVVANANAIAGFVSLQLTCVSWAWLFRQPIEARKDPALDGAVQLLELARSGGGNLNPVDQLRAGWNSLLDWLREVQAWNQPAEAVE